MTGWEVVTTAQAAVEEYKHRRNRETRAPWFTEQNVKLLLLAINIVRVLFLP